MTAPKKIASKKMGALIFLLIDPNLPFIQTRILLKETIFRVVLFLVEMAE